MSCAGEKRAESSSVGADGVAVEFSQGSVHRKSGKIGRKMDGPSGPNAPPFAHSHSPTPSPSPSHSASASLSGSGQKRKRSDDHASSLGFPGNPNPAHLPHTFSNLHPNAHSHPSSISHESRDGPATSVDEDEDNGGTGGDESGMNHSQLDSISAGDPDAREEYEEDDDDDDDGNEDDAEQDDEDAEEDDEEADEDDAMRTFTAARLEGSGTQRPSVTVKSEGLQTLGNVKTEPVNESSKDAAIGTATVTPTLASSAILKEEPNKAAATDTIQTSGAYCSREENFKREEDAGRLKFLCYSNDGVDQHMIWLVGLKNIFARQLPNMPKEYIVRLVMDRSHKSMMIIKNSQVVGGITYRPYASQRFGEIAFCAITADEQVKGYGTRLMNHLKQHARDDDGLTNFLTYADNNAVGYFIKQGFTKEITMEKERWQGYIKDYDGGTLMECQLDAKLPYIDLPALIRRQRQLPVAPALSPAPWASCPLTPEGFRALKQPQISKNQQPGCAEFALVCLFSDNGSAVCGFSYILIRRTEGVSMVALVVVLSQLVLFCILLPSRVGILSETEQIVFASIHHLQAIDEKIRELSNCHVVYPGIEISKKEAGIPRRLLRIEDIPGLKDAGWVPEQWGANSRIRLLNSTTDGPPTRQALHAFMRMLLKAIVEHADAWPFKDPVDPREVPDYYDIIKDPIDLKTIAKRLESEMYYLTLDMFSADLKRMFANARTYNSPETIYFKCANRLEVFFSNKLQAGIQTIN
ncbi:hypothetical protein L7F22_046486 [Adiantum nelumboides]|nr:hypothetical protein [Adiantum nelumboides]